MEEDRHTESLPVAEEVLLEEENSDVVVVVVVDLLPRVPHFQSQWEGILWSRENGEDLLAVVVVAAAAWDVVVVGGDSYIILVVWYG